MSRLAGVVFTTVLAIAPVPAAAQGVAFQVGRMFDDGGWTSFGVRWVRPVIGPIAAEVGGIYLRAPARASTVQGSSSSPTRRTASRFRA